MVPIPPVDENGGEGGGEGGGGEEGVWPPLPQPPSFPDLSGKSLALACIYISRHVSVLRWIVIDHDEAKEKFQNIKDKMPAGGIGGRPPDTRPIPPREPR